MMPPLALDPTAEATLGAASLSNYRKSAFRFATWLLEQSLSPRRPQEWDDLLVEWKNAVSPTKSDFCTTLAALEFFFCHLKGHMP